MMTLTPMTLAFRLMMTQMVRSLLNSVAWNTTMNNMEQDETLIKEHIKESQYKLMEPIRDHYDAVENKLGYKTQLEDTVTKTRTPDNEAIIK